MDMNNGTLMLAIIIVVFTIVMVTIRAMNTGGSSGGNTLDPDARVTGHRAEVVGHGKNTTIKNTITFSDGYIYVGYGGGTRESVGYGMLKISQGPSGVLNMIGLAITDHDNAVKRQNKKAVKTGKTIVDIPELGLPNTLGELRKSIFVQTWKCTYCGGETSLDFYECAHCGKHKA